MKSSTSSNRRPRRWPNIGPTYAGCRDRDTFSTGSDCKTLRKIPAGQRTLPRKAVRPAHTQLDLSGVYYPRLESTLRHRASAGRRPAVTDAGPTPGLRPGSVCAGRNVPARRKMRKCRSADLSAQGDCGSVRARWIATGPVPGR